MQLTWKLGLVLLHQPDKQTLSSLGLVTTVLLSETWLWNFTLLYA